MALHETDSRLDGLRVDLPSYDRLEFINMHCCSTPMPSTGSPTIQRKAIGLSGLYEQCAGQTSHEESLLNLSPERNFTK